MIRATICALDIASPRRRRELLRPVFPGDNTDPTAHYVQYIEVHILGHPVRLPDGPLGSICRQICAACVTPKGCHKTILLTRRRSAAVI